MLLHLIFFVGEALHMGIFNVLNGVVDFSLSDNSFAMVFLGKELSVMGLRGAISGTLLLFGLAGVCNSQRGFCVIPILNLLSLINFSLFAHFEGLERHFGHLLWMFRLPFNVRLLQGLTARYLLKSSDLFLSNLL